MAAARRGLCPWAGHLPALHRTAWSLFWLIMLAYLAGEVTVMRIAAAAGRLPMPALLRGVLRLAAAAEADTEASDAQKEAGNYRKGHIAIGGLDIAIENPKGSVRSGVSKSGKKWSIILKDHYGYIKRTKSEADGDHIDVFIGPTPNWRTMFIVDQIVPATGKFDEIKCMLGYRSADEAKAAYLRNYAPGWRGFGAITPMTVDGFRRWLASGVTSRPIGGAPECSA